MNWEHSEVDSLKSLQRTKSLYQHQILNLKQDWQLEQIFEITNHGPSNDFDFRIPASRDPVALTYRFLKNSDSY